MVQSYSLHLWGRVAVAALLMTLGAGITSGFTALKPALLETGVLSHLCSTDEQLDGIVCDQQTLALNRIFAFASSGVNLVCWPAGVFYDYVQDPRKVYVYGSVWVLASLVLFALSISSTVWLNFPGFQQLSLIFSYVNIGAGGSVLYVALLSFVFLPPARTSKESSYINAIFHSTYTLSAGVFWVIQWLFSFVSFSLPAIVFCYSLGLFPIVLLFGYYFNIPSHILAFTKPLTIKEEEQFPIVTSTPSKSRHGEINEIIPHTPSSRQDPHDPHGLFPTLLDNRFDQQQLLQQSPQRLPVDIDDFSRSGSQDLGTIESSSIWILLQEKRLYVLWLLVASVGLQCTWYLATLYEQLLDICDNNKTNARYYNDYFTLLFPLMGCGFAPIVGWILGSKIWISWLVLILLNAIWTTTSILPFPFLQWITFLAFTLWYVFSGALIVQYVQNIFPSKIFGSVYMGSYTFTGFMLFSMLALDPLAVTYLNHNYAPINITLCLGSLCFGGTLMWITRGIEKL